VRVDVVGIVGPRAGVAELADDLARMADVSQTSELLRRASADRGAGVSIEIPATATGRNPGREL